jgi:hypothetical protein
MAWGLYSLRIMRIERGTFTGHVGVVSSADRLQMDAITVGLSIINVLFDE